MSGNEKKIHRVLVNTGQPMVVPRYGTFALRRSRLMKRRFRQVFYATGMILSMAAIGQASYGFLMEIPYFSVKEPTIEGVSEPLRKEIEGLVRSLTDLQPNLLNLDTSELESQIARHPRIRDINVSKTYPDHLKITAVERKEVAIAITANGSFLLDNEGHVMGKMALKDLKAASYPYITGLLAEGVNEGETIDSASLGKALSLLQVLEARNPKLYTAISDIHIQSDTVSPLETLTAHMKGGLLKGGLEIRFGDQNPVEKLPALETLLTKLKDDGIDPFEKLAYIDLRFDDMAVYMDKETALDIIRQQYDELQKGVDQATEQYQAANPVNGGEKKKSESSSDDANNAPSRKSTNVKKARRSPTTPPRAAQPPPRNQNYAQPYQQYAPSGGSQLRQAPQTRGAAPLYNLPANQPR